MSQEKKEIKINIKNAQIAEALQLGKLKAKLAGKKAETKEETSAEVKKPTAKAKKVEEPEVKEEAPRRKARSRSAFTEEETHVEEMTPPVIETPAPPVVEKTPEPIPEEPVVVIHEPPPPVVKKETPPPPAPQKPTFPPKREMLGPTGRHVKDLLPRKPAPTFTAPRDRPVVVKPRQPIATPPLKEDTKADKFKPKVTPPTEEEEKAKGKAPKFKEFRDVKPTKKPQGRFDGRDRYGLRDNEDDQRWRKKRGSKASHEEDTTIRPTILSVRLPISIKDLAVAMKLKSSQLIAKLFLQGVVVTINDLLEDETTVQLLGQEFGCEIKIDTTEEERIRITAKTSREEIAETDSNLLKVRAPIVTFMGHVDHGKTSLIDYIRKASVASGEAGAITQHIGAFKCSTAVGDIAILDTPGHEAFSSMRARGAVVTDIVVLVIAGDEGIRAQTEEAINHAKAAGVTIIVAINKVDKPNFNPENVYRQLSDHALLPEAWGGQIITVNTSATTGAGVKELLEMLAIQAEVLELKANPTSRARGTVLESELHKGLGSVATVLVQNGTLKLGDPLVFGQDWGRVKTMHDEYGRNLKEAGPSTPVEITGLSGLPEAGEEFIVVSTEEEARHIAEARMQDRKQTMLQPKKVTTMESMLQQATDSNKKVLKIVLKADVQGSLEALKVALLKIKSEKVDVDIISATVGEISESDVLLAAASKAIIVGFHTKVESHAEQLLKQHGIKVCLHDIIYHAIDEVKVLMTAQLDRIAQETDRGKAEVRAVFKSSQHGQIAGCMVTEGVIQRNHYVRLKRGGEQIWKGPIHSLKRVKEDVREVLKGFECGILLNGFNDFKEGDILESYEITYLTQTL